MAKNKSVMVVHMKSSESGYMYHTMKNKKKHPERMTLRKYDPLVRRHVEFKEEKK